MNGKALKFDAKWLVSSSTKAFDQPNANIGENEKRMCIGMRCTEERNEIRT
jgi:hypothetical protein